MPNQQQVDPLQQLARDISSVQTSVNALSAKTQLSSLRDRVEDLTQKINTMPQSIRDLRTGGYAFEKSLEEKAISLNQRWSGQKPSVLMQINQQANALQADLRNVQSQMGPLSANSRNIPAARPLLSRLKSEVSTLESRASAAETSINGMFDSIQREANQLSMHLEKIKWMLQQIAEAGFTLLNTESGIMAVKATWARSGKETKDDPDGILFLTDQRLLFEQKEKVATKKVLFIATESKELRQLLFEAPLGLIEDIKTSKQGLFKNEDHIDIQFASGAPFSTAHFHLNGLDCNEWKALVNRARTKEFDKDRAIEIDKTAEEKVKAAPTKCPNCGGALNVQVLRGMDSINCPFCGSVIRL